MEEYKLTTVTANYSCKIMENKKWRIDIEFKNKDGATGSLYLSDKWAFTRVVQFLLSLEEKLI